MSIHNEMHRNYKKQTVPPVFIIGIVAVVIVAIVLMAILGAFSKGDKDNISSMASVVESEVASIEPASSSSKPVSSSSKVTSTSSTQSTSSQVASAYVPNGDWRLVVANKQHPLPKSYKVNVTNIIGTHNLDSRIVNDYKEMIAAANADGVSLHLISSFRTYARQETLFNNKVNYYKGQGNSTEKAKELAALYVAPPGTSEHLTGLAVDIVSPDWYTKHNSLTSEFEETEQFEWLYTNCAKYGFVLRYPKDKVSITGYNYEPWHYRYVGVEAAKEIMDRKICLEEYVAGLN